MLDDDQSKIVLVTFAIFVIVIFWLALVRGSP